MVVCTTTGCNSPITDKCGVGGFTSLFCDGAVPSTLNTTAASDIKCWVNGALQTTATPGNRVCVAFSVVCDGTRDQSMHCPVNATAGAYRVRSSISAIAATMNAAYYRNDILPTAESIGAVLASQGAPLDGAYSPSFPYRAYLTDLFACNTEGCNAPSLDACAISTTPVTATVAFNNLPANATDLTGKLTPAAAIVLTTSIQKAVGTACSTCRVTLQTVVDAAGKTLFSAARRLQAGSVIVTFSVSGGTTTALARVAAAAASPAFAAAVTSALAATPGYGGVTATSTASTPAKPDPPLGLLGLIAVLLLVPIAYFACKRSGAKAVMPQQSALAIKTAPAAGAQHGARV